MVEGGDLVTRVRRFMRQTFPLSKSFQVFAPESVSSMQSQTESLSRLTHTPEQGGCHSVCEGLRSTTLGNDSVALLRVTISIFTLGTVSIRSTLVRSPYSRSGYANYFNSLRGVKKKFS